MIDTKDLMLTLRVERDTLVECLMDVGQRVRGVFFGETNKGGSTCVTINEDKVREESQ